LERGVAVEQRFQGRLERARGGERQDVARADEPAVAARARLADRPLVDDRDGAAGGVQVMGAGDADDAAADDHDPPAAHGRIPPPWAPVTPARSRACRTRQVKSVSRSTSDGSSFWPWSPTRKNQFPPQATSPVTRPWPGTSTATPVACRQLGTFSSVTALAP